jgi:tripartite ATP-independent transporter DctM subunit
MPIALVVLGAAVAFVASHPALVDLGLVQSFVNATMPFPLITIPLFLLAGELMNASGITRRMMDFAGTLTGHLPGGLAQVNVVVSTLKGGMSGSANADAAMDAKMLVPEMTRRGYDPAFSSAITATSSFTAALLPPSILLLMFGFVTDTSVGALFMGGLVPSLILTFAFMGVTHVIARRRGYGGDLPRAKLPDVWRAFVRAYPAILLPLLIALGIRTGVFTPSEAGAVAVAYALVFCAATGETSLVEVGAALRNTVVTSAAIMFVLAATGALSWALTYEQVPQAVARTLTGLTQDPYLLLGLIALCLLVVGIFIEALPMILILGPMFTPATTAAGIDPVLFGVFFCLLSLIGAVTPPVGSVMFTTCSITKVAMAPFWRECVPYVAATLVTVIVIVAIPQTVTWLARI